ESGAYHSSDHRVDQGIFVLRPQLTSAFHYFISILAYATYHSSFDPAISCTLTSPHPRSTLPTYARRFHDHGGHHAQGQRLDNREASSSFAISRSRRGHY